MIFLAPTYLIVMFFNGQYQLILSVLGAFLLHYSVYSQSQAVGNMRIEEKRNVIEIRYDLQADEPGLQFKITPYYVDDKGNRNILSLVSGDIGEGVMAGNDKLITWAFRRELDAYQGEMKIDINYEILPPKVAISLAKDKYKRTGKVLLKLDTIRAIRYDIIDPNRKVYAQGQLEQNKDAWGLPLPKKLPVPETYRIRVWDAGGIPAYTSEFYVQRKIPMSTRIIGIAVIAGGIVYLILKPKPDPDIEAPSVLPNR